MIDLDRSEEAPGALQLSQTICCFLRCRINRLVATICFSIKMLGVERDDCDDADKCSDCNNRHEDHHHLQEALNKGQWW